MCLRVLDMRVKTNPIVRHVLVICNLEQSPCNIVLVLSKRLE